MSITNAKIAEYQCVITNKLKNVLTPAQLTQAKKTDFIKMWEAEAGGNGSTDKLSVAISWLKAHPIACKFLTTPSVAEGNFQEVITTTFPTTAANGLPSTYIALHAENKANEPKLAGLLALRAHTVDSTYKDDGANLGAGSAGNALSDAYVMGLYTTWGATKFNTIFNKDFLTSIKNDSNASYNTLATISSVYTGWNHTVSVNDFFAGVTKLVKAGVSGLKFSDLMADADNQVNFNLHTSDAVATLMGSTGGSWSGVTGLSAPALSELTSPNAITIIKKCGGNFTNMSAVYNADITKFDSLTSQNAVQLMLKGYSGIDFPGLSTGYGTTYTLAADTAFNTIIDPDYNDLWANGVTYNNMKAINTSDRLKAFTSDIKGIMMTDAADYNQIAADLVGGSMALGGLETLGDIA